jgi:hypothetical protein
MEIDGNAVIPMFQLQKGRTLILVVTVVAANSSVQVGAVQLNLNVTLPWRQSTLSGLGYQLSNSTLVVLGSGASVSITASSDAVLGRHLVLFQSWNLAHDEGAGAALIVNVTS